MPEGNPSLEVELLVGQIMFMSKMLAVAVIASTAIVLSTVFCSGWRGDDECECDDEKKY